MKFPRKIAICALIFTWAFAFVVAQPAIAQTFSVLHAFTGGTDGGEPSGSPVVDSRGNIYGTAMIDGDPVCVCGVVFKIDTTGAYSVVHTFVGTDGRNPASPLVLDAAGNIYGSTNSGGPGGAGVVFKLTPDGTYKILHAFTDARDGGNPQGVTLDGAGNFYGVSKTGGPNNSNNCNFGCGVFWKLSPPGKLTVLHNFAGGDDGNAPVGLVARDSAGNIYGVTQDGGSTNNYGTVFKYTTTGLYSRRALTGGDGFNPVGGLTLDGAGNFYGATSGPSDGGVFGLTTNLNFVGFFAFNGTDGLGPNGELALDSAGNIYGTTFSGGPSEDGVVYEITSSGETVLHAFDTSSGGANGQNPNSGVALDSSGNIYGTTYHGGGGTNVGVVFKIVP